MSDKYCYILQGEDAYEPSCIIDVYTDESKAEERADKLRKRMDRYQRELSKYSEGCCSGKFPANPRHNYESFEVREYIIK